MGIGRVRDKQKESAGKSYISEDNLAMIVWTTGV